MPQVRITNEAHEALLRESEQPELAPGQHLENGDWQISLGWDTIHRLRRHRLEGESLSDVIVRILSTQKGLN